ncbi:type VI secretion protein [Gammaproteobacteria bacterium 45_16_T64]|nr:type VI secretion protein [Gammaproteobacteria bacterium 45_16_T64]
MSDELLPYYEKELAFIRRSGADFSESHPKIAGRLGVNADTVEDPHVSRLLEGFAYLNARIQHKLDDEFPELTDALLNVAYPHYLRPIPSFSIVQFNPEEDLDSVFSIPKNTLLETDSFQGKSCKFNTGYDVELLPIMVANSELQARPFIAPGANQVQNAGAVLRIEMKTLSDKISLSEVAPNNVRFFLKGQPQHMYPLHRMIMNEAVKIVIARREDDPTPIYLNIDRIKPVGYTEEEGLLPYPPQSFIGYRLLTEYFCFPEKFLFVDIDLTGIWDESFTNELNLYIYLDTSNTEIERNISAENFALGCTPIINLFSQQADPLRLSHTQQEYHIIPDARTHDALEIYSIDEVKATMPDGTTTEHQRFYGLKHELTNKDISRYWYGTRRDASMSPTPNHDGSEVFVSLTDLQFNPQTPANQTLSIKTHCINRDLPSKLPYGGGQPRLHCVDSAPPVTNISCITPPTHTVRPTSGDRARWRLLSHLNLNHLSISGDGDATDTLREILRLYDFNESASTRSLINSILKVSTQYMTAPITIDGRTTLCRGTQITVEFDEALLSGTSAYMFASVLEQFFGVYCTLNSFTRLIATLKGKDGVLKRWAPRAGEKALV